MTSLNLQKQVQGLKHKYTLNPDLSIGRYLDFERLSIELLCQKTAKQIGEEFKNIFLILTSGNEILPAVHSAAQLALNNSHGMDRVTSADPNTALLVCTLFYNREGEDTSTWDIQLATEKIEDWKQLPVADFFSSALVLYDGPMQVAAQAQEITERFGKKAVSEYIDSDSKTTTTKTSTE